MAGQQRKMEGNDDQRRAAARDARAQGKRPSEIGATLGASKQRASAAAGDSHQERIDQRHEGKASRAGRSADAGTPRPGNRDADPKRDDARYE